jgi:uncharacterized protein YkwD
MIFVPVDLSFAGFSQRLDDKAKAIVRNTEDRKAQALAKSNYKLNSKGNCPKLEREVVELVNQEREEVNEEREENEETPLKILKVKNVLKSTARAKSKEMYKSNKFAHERPNGDPFWTLLDEPKYKIKGKQEKRAENIQCGESPCMPTPQEIFDKFKKSPKHYKNMIGDFDYLGVGFYCKKEGEYYRWYLTQHFVTFF